jgi:hypothetical protein
MSNLIHKNYSEVIPKNKRYGLLPPSIQEKLGVSFMRYKTDDDGSCLIHAIMNALNPVVANDVRYRDLKKTERKKFVTNKRRDIFETHFTKDQFSFYQMEFEYDNYDDFIVNYSDHREWMDISIIPFLEKIFHVNIFLVGLVGMGNDILEMCPIPIPMFTYKTDRDNIILYTNGDHFETVCSGNTFTFGNGSAVIKTLTKAYVNNSSTKGGDPYVAEWNQDNEFEDLLKSYTQYKTRSKRILTVSNEKRFLQKLEKIEYLNDFNFIFDGKTVSTTLNEQQIFGDKEVTFRLKVEVFENPIGELYYIKLPKILNENSIIGTLNKSRNSFIGTKWFYTYLTNNFKHLSQNTVTLD